MGRAALAATTVFPECFQSAHRVPRYKVGAVCGTGLAPETHMTHLPLQDEQLSAALREELSQLERFCCGTFYGQRVEPLRPVSFNVYREELW